MQFLRITKYFLAALRKISKATLLVLIFFTVDACYSFAQQGILRGQVNDETTALSFATVAMANYATITDLDGWFSMAINPGTYKLVVTHTGFKNFEQEIIIIANQTQTVTINMIRTEQFGEAEILGSRSLILRSNLNTPVPVDRISSKTLIQTGQPSLLQMLNFAAPSFNISRPHLAEPVTLRGLSPDHVLILMNGTRYHSLSGINQGGVNGTLGRGSVANDINSIPISAIEKIEILRDGATAQYGSDAIAGVINIALKKSTGKTFINLHTGQHYKGDGENIVFGINRGISLNKKGLIAGRQGFLNFSGDFRHRKPTHRGGEYLGTVYYTVPQNASPAIRDSLIALDNNKIRENGFSRKTPVSNDGSIELTSSGFLVNGAYSISKQVELFWTGTVNYRHPVSPGAYRFPKNKNQVNTALHPDGFKNINIVNTWDISAITGARGKTNNAWNWQWTSVYGQNSSLLHWRNTNNASQFALGANAPSEFYGGKTIFIQQTNSFSLSRDLAKELGGVKTFNIGLGAEYRIEKFQNWQGEEAAWKNYDTTGRTQGGAQPAPGVSPEDEVNETRTVKGLYIDLESDVNDRLLINVASRYEHYNYFGSNLAGKMAIRYKISPAFTLRGSVSNGYHAPALQQIYYNYTSNSGFRREGDVNIPVRVGVISNNSPLAKAFGVNPLRPERAENLGLGFTSTLSPHINVTVDAYGIKIKNRIVLSGIFDKTNPAVKQILQDWPGFDQVQFVTNAINTKTQGIDIVMNGNWNIKKANIGWSLAANFTRTRVYGPIQTTAKLPADSLNSNTLFNREERATLEQGQPGSKIILSAHYKKGKTGFLIRSTRFGKTAAVFVSANPSLDEFFSAKILTDVSINYMVKTWLTLTAGANNIFDVYPDPVKNSGNKNQGILIYTPRANPFGFNGGYYFVSMAFGF